MKKWYYFLFAKVRAYFGFSVAESQGFLVLMLLTACIGIAPVLYSFFPPTKDPSAELADQRTLDSLVALLPSVEEKPIYSSPKSTFQSPKTANLFPFDPNTATKNDFMALGLPEFLASRILKYRDKGGKFKSSEDFSKIYGLRKNDFDRLKPFIQITSIPASLSEKKEKDFSSKKAPEASFKPIDINLADSLSLVKVKGIGNVLASRIIKFRGKLGGFVSMNQLSEVYGLDSAVVSTLQSQFFVSPSFVPSKVLINKSDFQTLASHPYVGKKLAGVLLNYKKQHGAYRSITDLENIRIIPAEKLVQLKPYLSWEE